MKAGQLSGHAHSNVVVTPVSPLLSIAEMFQQDWFVSGVVAFLEKRGVYRLALICQAAHTTLQGVLLEMKKAHNQQALSNISDTEKMVHSYGIMLGSYNEGSTFCTHSALFISTAAKNLELDVCRHWKSVVNKDIDQNLGASILTYTEAVNSRNECLAEQMMKRAEWFLVTNNTCKYSLGMVLCSAAVSACDISKLKFFLNNGADINYNQSLVDDEGKTRNVELNTALHNVVALGMSSESEFLLKSGAKPGIINALGNTVLHNAAVWKNDIFVQLLFNDNYNKHEMKPIINIQNKAGQTALHLAAANQKSSIVKLLLAKGADPAILDNQGRSYDKVVR